MKILLLLIASILVSATGHATSETLDSDTTRRLMQTIGQENTYSLFERKPSLLPESTRIELWRESLSVLLANSKWVTEERFPKTFKFGKTGDLYVSGREAYPRFIHPLESSELEDSWVGVDPLAVEFVQDQLSNGTPVMEVKPNEMFKYYIALPKITPASKGGKSVVDLDVKRPSWSTKGIKIFVKELTEFEVSVSFEE